MLEAPFRLSGDGEALALLRPEGSIASNVGPFVRYGGRNEATLMHQPHLIRAATKIADDCLCKGSLT